MAKDDSKKRIKALVKEARKNPDNFKYSDLCKICDHYFGDARQKSTSQRVYKMPWAGDPRVNIQRGKGGKAKSDKLLMGLKYTRHGIVLN